MLDALRRYGTPPRDPDRPLDHVAPDRRVPASLAYQAGRPHEDPGASSGRRLVLVLVLVAVTALLLWQVAATNGLLPPGPLWR